MKKLFYKIFKRYRRLELKLVMWPEADKMIKANKGKPASEQWVIAKEEDTNSSYGMVYLERKERITK